MAVTERPTRVEVGEVCALRVRSPLGFVLRVRLRLVRVEPPRMIEAVAEGDLAGTGRAVLRAEVDGSTAIEFTWEVVPLRRGLRAGGPLRPILSLAHAVVMLAGQRSLRRAVRDR